MDTIVERFWPKVRRTSGCWFWEAAADQRGYGKILAWGRPQSAHRVAWILTHGEVPPGIEVCHACDVPACVNPSHLFLGTHADNMRDRDRKGRLVTPRGAHESAKTHCPQGHAYDEANTLKRRGKRGCRTCHRERATQYRLEQGRIPGARLGRYSGMTACTKGHPYTEENTRTRGRHHVCRICTREYMRERRRQEREAGHGRRRTLKE